MDGAKEMRGPAEAYVARGHVTKRKAARGGERLSGKTSVYSLAKKDFTRSRPRSISLAEVA